MQHKRLKKKVKLEDWGKPRKRKKIENWGKKRIFNKKTRELFQGIGIATVTAMAVIILLGGLLLLASLVKQAVEKNIKQNLSVNLQNINKEYQPVPTVPQAPTVVTTTPPAAETPAVPVPETPVPQPQASSNLPTYTSAVFFSGVGWINSASTTLYRDNNEAAMTFPPKYEWQITQPISNDEFRISNTVPGITTKVVQDGSQYKILVYAPDGSAILTETSTPIISSYPGEVGIGGTPDDFLVVYGSYWGAGARIVKINGSWQVQNVSQFLGIRQMNGGFKPAVVRSTMAVSGNTIVTYYVYSLTDGNPKLIKLFTDSSGNIAGAIDLSSLLFARGERSAEFADLSMSGAGRLGARVTDANGNVSFYSFTDEGFDKSEPLEVDSVNLNGFPIKISEATISDLGYSSGIGAVSFYLSNDGVNWLPAAPGSEVKFAQANNQIFWRAVFQNTPGGDYFSPYLSEIRVEYGGTLF